MGISLGLVEQKINDDTRACVERTKKSKPFGGFFYPRKKAEPDCKLQAQAKYANEWEAAQKEAKEEEDWADDAFRREVSGEVDKKTLLLIGGTFVFMLVMVLLID